MLYHWQSPDPRARVTLLEFLTRRAASMALSLPLGEFERFESVTVNATARCAVKLHEDQALFVRVRTDREEAVPESSTSS